MFFLIILVINECHECGFLCNQMQRLFGARGKNEIATVEFTECSYFNTLTISFKLLKNSRCTIARILKAKIFSLFRFSTSLNWSSFSLETNRHSGYASAKLLTTLVLLLLNRKLEESYKGVVRTDFFALKLFFGCVKILNFLLFFFLISNTIALVYSASVILQRFLFKPTTFITYNRREMIYKVLQFYIKRFVNSSYALVLKKTAQTVAIWNRPLDREILKFYHWALLTKKVGKSSSQN